MRWCICSFLLAAGLFAQNPDEFARLHKYGADPHQPLSSAERVEYTYTITSVMQLAKPYRVSDMTDEYQDARVLSEDPDSVTVQITYYPLNTNGDAVGENRNWRRDYAGMTEYLRPTPTENWNAQMRTDLIAALRADGIDPNALTDRQLVRLVSWWLIKRSRDRYTFSIFEVDFLGGAPRVFPSLRAAFDKEKPSPTWSDQEMFDHEVLGRAMFYNKARGACTSTSVLMATVLRALGIPTRIVFFVPPVDGNDPEQAQMLLAAVHHHAVRKTIRHALPSKGESDQSFVCHIYNEVYVGNRWVRLNFDELGQNILDEDYLGLMTHILTTASLAEVPLAQTWGLRVAAYPKVRPALSSLNPYRLLKVSDHFGARKAIPNPEVEDEDPPQLTVLTFSRKDAAVFSVGLALGLWLRGRRKAKIQRAAAAK